MAEGANHTGQMQSAGGEGGDDRTCLNSRAYSVWLRLLVWGALLAGCSPAVLLAADASPKEFASQLWISPGIYSAHFDRSKNLRNDNPGLSIEYQFAEDHSVAGGSYINSNGARTHYGAYAWRPLHAEVAGLKVRAGVALGVFDGYPFYRDGAPFIAPLPVIGIEGERFGVNVIVIPTIRDRLYGALSLQLKFRIW